MNATEQAQILYPTYFPTIENERLNYLRKCQRFSFVEGVQWQKRQPVWTGINDITKIPKGKFFYVFQEETKSQHVAWIGDEDRWKLANGEFLNGVSHYTELLPPPFHKTPNRP